jgi:hypothetical protein
VTLERVLATRLDLAMPIPKLENNAQGIFISKVRPNSIAGRNTTASKSRI